MALVLVPISVRYNKTFSSAATLYCAGWIFLLLSGVTAVHVGTIPRPTEGALALIEVAHVAAFLGLLLGSFLAGSAAPASKRAIFYLARLDVFFQRHQWKMMGALLLLGSLHLLEAFLTVGGGSNLLLRLRHSYLDLGLTPLGRASAYLHTGSAVIAIVLGLLDRAYGVRFARLILLTLACTPHGIAMGGRGFLLGLVLPYGVSFLLGKPIQRRRSRDRSIRRRFLSRIAVYIVVALVAFAVLGNLRGGREGVIDSFLDPVVGFATWFATSLPAIEPFAMYYTEFLPRGYGRHLLQWPTAQLERIGILEGSRRDQEWDVILMIRRDYGIIGNAPPTIIPHLIADFGRWGFPLAVALLMGFAQVLSVRLRAKPLLGHVIATLAALAAFTSIQVPNFLNAANSLALLWAGVLTLVMRRRLSSASQRLITGVRQP
jgi:oligosaccharide repeat unit polymerase